MEDGLMKIGDASLFMNGNFSNRSCRPHWRK